MFVLKKVVVSVTLKQMSKGTCLDTVYAKYLNISEKVYAGRR